MTQSTQLGTDASPLSSQTPAANPFRDASGDQVVTTTALPVLTHKEVVALLSVFSNVFDGIKTWLPGTEKDAEDLYNKVAKHYTADIIYFGLVSSLGI